MSEIQRIIKEWRDFATAQLHENGMLAEQLEFTVRVADEWKARAEAAEKRVAELEARLAWRPVTEARYNDGNERPEFYKDVELLIVGFMNDSGRWIYNEDMPGFRSPVKGWRPLNPSNSTALAATE